MSDQNQNVVTKSPIKFRPSEIDARRNELSGEVVGKPFVPSGLVPIAEPRFSPEIPMNVPDADLRSATYDRTEVQRRRRGEPLMVDADITAEMFTRPRAMAAILCGGPCDGEERDVPQTLMQIPVAVDVDPATIKPFVHVPGQPNIVQGALTTVYYKRTNRKTPDGARCFDYQAPQPDPEPAAVTV